MGGRVAGNAIEGRREWCIGMEDVLQKGGGAVQRVTRTTGGVAERGGWVNKRGGERQCGGSMHGLRQGEEDVVHWESEVRRRAGSEGKGGRTRERGKRGKIRKPKREAVS